MEEQNLQQEAARFQQQHPEVTELTDGVTEAWAGGESLEQAWKEHGTPQPDRAEEIRKQNEETALRAPVAGVTASGSVQQPRRDDFLSGFEQDHW